MEPRWDRLDAAAEREAEALRRARRHRSAFIHSTGNSPLVSREQAAWDEALSEHSPTCYYCGRTLQDTMPSEKRGVDNTFIDVCGPCAFLHDLNKRVSSRHDKHKRGGRRYDRRQDRSPVRV